MGCSREMLNRLWGGHGLVNLLVDNTLDKKPLWRHTSFAYFVKMLVDKKNILPHVSKWKDPFEGIIFNANYLDEDDREVRIEDVYARFFGQCWSLNDCDNELLWNARSPHGNGVCLKTKVEKIKNALLQFGDAEHPPCVVVGKIRYGTMNSIKNIVQEMGRRHEKESALGRLSENGIISMFFLKRDSFKDESELRIVANIGKELVNNRAGVFEVVPGRFGGPNIVQYEIDAKDFIDEVILDPRMPKEMLALVEKLRDDNGWQFMVRQSELYEYIVPKPTIRIYK